MAVGTHAPRINHKQAKKRQERKDQIERQQEASR